MGISSLLGITIVPTLALGFKAVETGTNYLIKAGDYAELAEDISGEINSVIKIGEEIANSLEI